MNKMTKDAWVEGKSKSFDSSKRRSTHICELSRGSDSNLLKLQPTAPLRARLKRLFQKTIIVTKKHPATRYYLRSRAAIAFEKKRHGRSPNWWIIHPCSAVRFVWEIIMSITYLFCFVVTPYTTAFYMLNSTSYHAIESSVIPAYFICLIDICFNFITGYASSNSHEIFLDPGLIASHYARGYFLIDLITSIPYSWILQDYHTVSDGENSNFATIVIELLPLLKVLRIHTLYMSLNQFMQVLRISHIPRLAIWLCLLSVMICHWAACFSYGFPFVFVHATKSRIQDSATWFTSMPGFSDPSKNTFTLYMYSFYWGLIGLLAIDSSIEGGKKTHSKEAAGDRLVTSILLIFGMVYQIYLLTMSVKLKVSQLLQKSDEVLQLMGPKIFAYNRNMIEKSLQDKGTLKRRIIRNYYLPIVVILQLVESAKAPETRYQQMTNSLKFYIQEKGISPKLAKQLLDHHEYRFQDRYFKENVIIGSLADHLKKEILMNTCRQLMESVGLFWNLPKVLLGNIIGALKPEIFLQDDIIYRCNDEGGCMYFIGKGTLAIITYEGKEICHLEDGSYFGESSLLHPNFRRPVTVIAVEACELFRFDRKDFKRLIAPNSDLYQRMRRVVQEQIKLLMRIENEELQGSDLERSVSNIIRDADSGKKKYAKSRREYLSSSSTI